MEGDPKRDGVAVFLSDRQAIRTTGQKFVVQAARLLLLQASRLHHGGFVRQSLAVTDHGHAPLLKDDHFRETDAIPLAFKETETPTPLGGGASSR